MDALKVQILLEAIDSRSMLKAAQRNGYTPSGLAHMMDALERELGVRIVERGSFGVRLTRAGQQLLPQLRQYVQAGQKLRNEAYRLSREENTLLRVGSSLSIARTWLPQLIHTFRDLHPEVQVEIHTADRESLYKELESDALDLVLANVSDVTRFDRVPLLRDEYRAVVPPNFGLQGSFPLQDFAKYPFIMPTFGNDKDVARIMRSHGVEPELVAATADDPVVIRMIAAGLGVSMLPQLALQGFEDQLCILPLDPPVWRELGICLRSLRDANDIERTFIRFIKAKCPVPTEGE